MYVCICNAVSDTEIRQAVDRGTGSFRELMMQTGCGTQCGSCVPHARAILDERLAENGQLAHEFGLQVVPAV